MFEDGNRNFSEFLNTPVQGTGADILKSALAALPLALKSVKGRVVTTVHDEIVISVPAEYASAAKDILNSVMVAAGEKYLKKVPTVVEIGIGDTWAYKA